MQNTRKKYEKKEESKRWKASNLMMQELFSRKEKKNEPENIQKCKRKKETRNSWLNVKTERKISFYENKENKKKYI